MTARVSAIFGFVQFDWGPYKVNDHHLVLKNDPLKEIIPIFGQLEQHLASVNRKDSPNLVVIIVFNSTCP